MKNEVKIPFYTDTAGVPILKATQNGKTYSILVDTGAEMSLVDKDFGGIIEESNRNSGYQLGTFLGSSQNIMQSAMCIVNLKDIKKKEVSLTVVADEAEFSMIKDKYDNLVMIIGSDQLNEWKAKIDYDKNILTVYGVSGN